MKHTLVLTTVAALALVGSGAAAPPVSSVVTVQKDVAGVEHETNPCTGGPTVVHSVGRFTFKLTVFADGTMQVHFDMHGTLDVDSVDPADEDFTGHWTESSTFRGTNGSATQTFTFSPHLDGTDGSRIREHYDAHMTVTEAGDVTVDLFHAVEHVDCA